MHTNAVFYAKARCTTLSLQKHLSSVDKSIYTLFIFQQEMQTSIMKTEHQTQISIVQVRPAVKAFGERTGNDTGARFITGRLRTTLW